MGTKLSIDKHVSNLHELLEMSAQYFQKVKFESKISADLTQHLKVGEAFTHSKGQNVTELSSFFNLSN